MRHFKCEKVNTIETFKLESGEQLTIQLAGTDGKRSLCAESL